MFCFFFYTFTFNCKELELLFFILHRIRNRDRGVMKSNITKRSFDAVEFTEGNGECSISRLLERAVCVCLPGSGRKVRFC